MGMKKSSQYSFNSTIDNYGYNVDGVIKADLGQYHEALEYFTKAIESEPENFISYFNRASIKMLLGDIDGARLDFRKCEILDTSDSIYS